MGDWARKCVSQMADVFDRQKRSEVMARIRGRGNKDTELALLVLLRRHRIKGWRRGTSVFGRPDFTFVREKVAVFVDGCFWHGCPKHSNLPVNNREFWARKLGANVARDRLVSRTLRRKGWIVVRIWEHDLMKNPDGCVRRVRAALERSLVRRPIVRVDVEI